MTDRRAHPRRTAATVALLALLVAITITTTSARAQSFPGLPLASPAPASQATLDAL